MNALHNLNGTPVSAALQAQFDRTYPVRRLPVNRPADGHATFRYCLKDVPLTCEIYWERKEKQTCAEPGWPAKATLESADCGGLNILEILSDDQRKEIETAFLEQQS